MFCHFRPLRTSCNFERQSHGVHVVRTCVLGECIGSDNFNQKKQEITWKRAALFWRDLDLAWLKIVGCSCGVWCTRDTGLRVGYQFVSASERECQFSLTNSATLWLQTSSNEVCKVKFSFSSPSWADPKLHLSYARCIDLCIDGMASRDKIKFQCVFGRNFDKNFPI